MTHGTTAASTIHGTTDMPDGMDTCTLIIADGTADGIHIGDTITTITILEVQYIIGTNGVAAATRAAPTESSQAEYLPAEAHQAAESAAMSQALRQTEWQAHLQFQAAEQQRQESLQQQEELQQSETARQ